MVRVPAFCILPDFSSPGPSFRPKMTAKISTEKQGITGIADRDWERQYLSRPKAVCGCHQMEYSLHRSVWNHKYDAYLKSRY